MPSIPTPRPLIIDPNDINIILKIPDDKGSKVQEKEEAVKKEKV